MKERLVFFVTLALTLVFQCNGSGGSQARSGKAAPAPNEKIADCSASNSTITVGKAEEYYLSGIFRHLNGSISEPLSSNQLSSLLDMLHIGNQTSDISENGNNISECFNIRTLLHAYDIHGENVQISLYRFLALCPALIHQQITHRCEQYRFEAISSTTTPAVLPDIPDAFSQRYGYGTAAVTIISVLPFFIFLVIPKPGSRAYPYTMNTLIALATSTLVSDGVLHLIPQSLGFYTVVQKNSTRLVNISDTLLKQVMLLSSLYAMYLFSMLMGIRKRVTDPGQGHGHGHGHGGGRGNEHRQGQRPSLAPSLSASGEKHSGILSIPSPSAILPHRNSSAMELINDMTITSTTQLAEIREIRSNSTLAPNSSCNELDEQEPAEQDSQEKQVDRIDDEKRHKASNALFPYLKKWLRECVPNKSYGYIILISDLTHNIMDGIFIGAAFSKSSISGVSTTVAVVFHEIPHEIGDFAALLTSGMTWRGAVTWNVILSMTAYIGLFIGLGISTDEGARQWVFAFTAGIFLHHALGEFLPELLEISDHFWTYFTLQNVGILIGFAVMFVLSIFDEALHRSFR